MQADHPVQGDSAPVLYDGSEDGRLLPQLLDRLSDRALDRVDMAVSFVMKSGLACILGPLEDALDRGAHVRILTTDYLAITDPDALTQLADLAEDPDRRLEVRLFSSANLLQKRTIPQTLSYPRTPCLREGSESCGRWPPGCCFGCGAFSAGPGGGGPDTFSVG